MSGGTRPPYWWCGGIQVKEKKPQANDFDKKRCMRNRRCVRRNKARLRNESTPPPVKIRPNLVENFYRIHLLVMNVICAADEGRF